MSTTSYTAFQLYLLIWLLGSLLSSVHCTIRLSATSPVNPVQEGGILSLHCQVWDLKEGQDVIILRTINSGSITQKVSLAETILDDEDERSFLAVRQSPDGSVVFFFTIMNVVVADAGVYSCRVLSDELEVVIADSVTFDIMNFPDETYPMCDPNEAHANPVQHGSQVSFTCSTATANPPITFHWSRTGGGKIPTANEVIRDGIHTSTITFRTGFKMDNKAVFLCEILSPEFPGRVRSCHIGPIVVTNTDKTEQGDDFSVPIGSNNKDTFAHTTTVVTDSASNNLPNDIAYKCQDVCAVYTPTDELFWIVVTVVATSLALIFIAIVIALTVKLCAVETHKGFEHGSSTMQGQPRTMVDCHYAELETGKTDTTDNSSVYMSLGKNTVQHQQYNTCESAGQLARGSFDFQYVLATNT